jgi:L-asparaginase
VVFDGLAHPAGEVVKAHSWRTDAFASEVPVAEIREGRVLVRNPPSGVRNVVADPGHLGPRLGEAHVPIVAVAAGMDGRALEQDNAAAVVLIALGAGHLPEEMLPGVDLLLARDVPVVICARPARGGTLERTYGFAGSEVDLAERGAILAGEASPWKARMRVLVALALDQDPRDLFGGA